VPSLVRFLGGSRERPDASGCLVSPEFSGVIFMAVVTIVGAGVIGIPWARLFGEAGREIRVSDPRPDLDEVVAHRPAGMAVTATGDLAAAVDGAGFVQEAGPERTDIKEQVFTTLAAHTRAALAPLDWPEARPESGSGSGSGVTGGGLK
jgi:2-polyprenyl-6-methoxyphenol hydroxylase-like FAD-dependent oxidoreductase